jgi:nucleolar protein 9
METFHCFTHETRQMKIVPLVSRLITYEVAEQPADDKPSCNCHIIGSQIVQTLLHFGKPIKIVQSLVEMETSQFWELLSDTFGSRIMDAFFSAEFVCEKSHDKLIQKLQGSFYSLATTKFGSRSLDSVWPSSPVKTRIAIGEELLQKETALQGNYFGRIIFENYALPLLKRQKSDWKTIQDKESKKRKLFADIVDPLAGEF